MTDRDESIQVMILVVVILDCGVNSKEICWFPLIMGVSVLYVTSRLKVDPGEITAFGKNTLNVV